MTCETTKIEVTFTEIRHVNVKAEIEVEDIQCWDKLSKDEKHDLLLTAISVGDVKETNVDFEEYTNTKIVEYKEID